MKKMIGLLLLTVIWSCGTVGKVTEKQDDGLFSVKREAKTIKSIEFDLDSHKSFLVVPSDKFMFGMAENLKYFDTIRKFKDFEIDIIKNNKQEEVGEIIGKIGLSNAYKKYKPYLYIRFENREDNNNYLQLKLINPGTAEELFVAEIFMDVIWKGVTDLNTYNPLFNELIKYIKINSKIYN